MKKLILAGAVLAIALMASITMGADMIAGNPKNGANVVGTVDVSVDGDNLVVVYTITDLDWIITETHLHVALSPDAIPQSKGNPPPGAFDYSTAHEVSDDVQEVTHTIPLVDILGDPVPDPLPTLFVAAHAVVGTLCPCDEFDLDLPEGVMVSVLWAGDFDPDRLDSYFLATIFGGTDLDGDYDAYCIDTDRSIRPPSYVHRGTPMQAEVYSSLDCGLLPVIVEPLVEMCENMGKVNWILNNVSVGQPIAEINPGTTCANNITMGDIQRAIWELLDDTEADDGLLDWDQCRVDEIIAAADGEFVPICGEVIGVIILPYVYMFEGEVLVVPGTEDDPPGYPGDPRYVDLPAEAELVYVQPIIITIPVPCCYCDETAWAGTVVDPPSRDWPDEDNDGYKYEFPGKNWAMYFTYPEDAVYSPVVATGKKK